MDKNEPIEITDADIEQILDRAQETGRFKPNLCFTSPSGRPKTFSAEEMRQYVERDRERCRKFLVRIREAGKAERKDEEWKGLPKEQPSPLEALMIAAKTKSEQLDHVWGEYWETMFCDKASIAGFHTRLLQRYKVWGEAHASRYLGLPEEGERDDITLPDVAVYQIGKGLITHVDVKHKIPRQLYPDFGIDFYYDRKRLLGDSPFHYAVHSYLPFDLKDWGEHEFEDEKWSEKWSEKWKKYWREHYEEYLNANRWSVDNPYEGWLMVRLTPDVVKNNYIALNHFVRAEEMLKDLAQG